MEISDLTVIVRDHVLAVAAAIALLCCPFVATAESEPEAVKSASAPKPMPQVDLGRLLKLPDSYAKPVESRRGMGQAEWEGRFERVRLDLAEAQGALQLAQTELSNTAGDSSQWSVAAPGTSPNPENTPLSYKLRQDIRRHREAIERADKKLRGLEIEADLADVPVEWRATHIGTAAKELAIGDAATTIR